MKPYRAHKIIGCIVLCYCLVVGHDAVADERVPQPTIERLSDLPVAVAGGALLKLSDNRLLYAGGTTWSEGKKTWLDKTFVYDIETDQWRSGPPLPSPFDASLPLSLHVDGRWLLLGGETANGVSDRGVELIDDDAEPRWQPTLILPFHKASATGGVIRQTLVVVGGADDHKSYGEGETSVWIGNRSAIDSGEWTWERRDDFPGLAHSVAAGVVYDDRLYVFGGFYTSNGQPLNSDQAFSYTPVDGWRALRPIPLASRGMTAVAIDGIGIILIGGWSDAGPGNDVFLYRPDTDDYHRVAEMPIPMVVASGIAIGNDVYLAGNEDKARSRRPDCFRLRFGEIPRPHLTNTKPASSPAR